MDHRPFEDWLLEDQPLNPEQKRELQSHLRTCADCTALAEVNLALRSARTVKPAVGFSARWQSRLAAERKLQRRRQVVGSTILSLGGAGLLVWMATPVVLAFLESPARWVVGMVNSLLFVMSSLEVLGEAAGVLVRVVPGFVPPYIWLVLASVLGGLGLLWTVSLWRFSRLPQRA